MTVDIDTFIQYRFRVKTTPIRISDRAWLALKKVQVDFKNGKAQECKTFWALLDAIGMGNDELLALWRKKMKEGKR